MKMLVLPSFLNKFTVQCSAILLCVVLLCPPAIAGTIAVNAGADINESGQSDVALIQRYCRNAGYPGFWLGVGNITADYMAQIGLDGVLGINVDNTDSGNSVNSSGDFIAGIPLESVLRDAKTYGYSPHIVVAQQRPGYLPPDAWTWPSSVWDQYKDYVYKFVRYIVRDYSGSGFTNTLIEVTSEVDIVSTESVWTQQNPGVPPTGTGSPERYAHLKTMYEIWQSAVTRVANENPDRTVRVAGPVVGPSYAPFSWRDAFIDDVANNGWRFDLYSFHTYGDLEGVGNGQPHPDFGYMRDNLQAIRNKLNSRGLSTPIAITEWGPSTFADGSSLGRINYTHEGAAWTIAFIKDVISKGLSSGVYLNMRDKFFADTNGNLTLTSFVHARDGAEYPKPVFNACKMLTQLAGSRKAVTLPSNQPNLVAIAASDGTFTRVIVANYNYLFDFPNRNFTDVTVPEDVTIEFNGLLFSGDAIVEQYLIDASTSNLAKYVDAGQQPDLNGTQLQKISEQRIKKTKGSVALSQVTLGKSAVSLWTIRKK
jgi:hypothetical protein